MGDGRGYKWLVHYAKDQSVTFATVCLLLWRSSKFKLSTLHFLIWIMHAKMIEKVRQSVTTYIRRSIFIAWFDQGGGVPCKYLTVRVDITHCFIVRIMNRVKQMLFHSYFWNLGGLKLSFTRIFGSTTCSKLSTSITSLTDSRITNIYNWSTAVTPKVKRPSKPFCFGFF